MLYPKHMNARVLEAMNGRLEICASSDRLVGKAGEASIPLQHTSRRPGSFSLHFIFPSLFYPIMSLSSVVFYTNLFSKSPRPSVMDSVRVFSACISQSSCRWKQKQHNFPVIFPASFFQYGHRLSAINFLRFLSTMR